MPLCGDAKGFTSPTGEIFEKKLWHQMTAQLRYHKERGNFDAIRSWGVDAEWLYERLTQTSLPVPMLGGLLYRVRKQSESAYRSLQRWSWARADSLRRLYLEVCEQFNFDFVPRDGVRIRGNKLGVNYLTFQYCDGSTHRVTQGLVI